MATDRTRINRAIRRILERDSQISPEAAERIRALFNQTIATSPAKQFVIEEPEDVSPIMVIDLTPTDD